MDNACPSIPNKANLAKLTFGAVSRVKSLNVFTNTSTAVAQLSTSAAVHRNEVARIRHASRSISTHAFLAVVAIVLHGTTMLAQTGSTGIVNTPALPVAGVGHNYIQNLNETVNPADGTVSVSIDLPVPPGRGITTPLSIAYSSSNSTHMVPSFQPANGVATYGWSPNWGFLSQGGWTYTLPTMSLALGKRYAEQSGNDEGGVPAYCYYLSGYSFRESTGESVPLYLSLVGPDPSPSIPGYICTQGFLTQSFYNTTIVSASLSSNSGVSVPEGEGNGTPALMATVSDPDGTIYNFSTYSPHYSGSQTAWAALPTFIEDRNGNKETISDNLTNCSISGPCSGTVLVNDTLGRQALAINGFGTTGNTISVAGIASSYVINWEAAAPVSSYPINITYEYYSGSNPPACVPTGSGSMSALAAGIQNIKLPNGQSYSFTYDSTYGNISQITYPSGGFVRYSYKLNTQSILDGFSDVTTNSQQSIGAIDCFYRYDQAVVGERDVSFDGTTIALTQTFKYATNWPQTPSNLEFTTKTTTVTTTDNISGSTYTTVYTYEPGVLQSSPNDNNPVSLHPSFPGNEIGVAYYNGSDSSGTPLLTVKKGWQGPDMMACEIDTLPGGQVSGTFYTWLDPGVFSDKKEYDYGVLSSSASLCGSTLTAPTGVTPTRETSVSFQQFPPSPLMYQQPSPSFIVPTIIDKPCSVSITGSNNSSQTSYMYDGGTTACGSAGAQSVPAPSSTLTSHDDSNFGASSTNARGNATTVTKQCTHGCSSSTTTYAYDDSGQVQSMVDGCGNATCADVAGSNHTTTFSYSDVPVGGNAGGNSNAYLTTITRPTVNGVAHVENYKYSYSNGLLVEADDENSKATKYQYDIQPTGCSYKDSLNRLGEIDYPDGGTTTYCYNDSPFSSTSPSVTTSQLLSSSEGSKITVALLDGLGHTIHTQLTDPLGKDYVDTTYNGLGQVQSVSNPYRSTNDSTYGITSYTYDALGRKSYQCQPDNIPLNATTCTPNNSYLRWSYSGNVTTFYDELRNSWQRTNDALGRLTNVVEPSGAKTGYIYDALDNLLTVNQNGVSGDTPRTRSFTYDSLSRLLCASNPENSQNACPTSATTAMPSGVTRYVYDSNGNLSSKTDARVITTSYSYDALNRVTSKSSVGATGVPGFTYNYGYDDATHSNGIGRLTHSSNNINGAENFFYDTMGRLNQETYCVPDNCSYGIQVGATYDLAGNTISLTYPDGRTVSQGIDGAGRVSSVNYASWNGTTQTSSYLTETNGYDAAGHLVNATLGNGTGLGAGYDSRERITQLVYGTTAQMLWGKQYQWAPNSNLQSTTDGITGTLRQFSYDNLNRLISAQDIVGTTSASAPPPASGPASGLDGSAGADPAPYWTDPDDSNTLINPETPGSSGWGENTASITGNVAAPDGSMTAYTFTASSGSTDSFLWDSVSDAYQYVGETMTGSVWLRAPSGNETVNLYLVEQGGTTGDNISSWKPVTVTTAWQQFQVSGQLQSGYSDLALQIGGGGTVTSGETISLWGLMVEDTGTSGPDITNFLPYSQQLNGSSWAGNADSVTLNAGTAPNGTNTAATVTAVAGSTDTYVLDNVQNPAPYSGQPMTSSVWLRTTSGTQKLNLYLVEISTGGWSVVASTAVTLTTTWQRFSVTGTSASGLTALSLQIGGGGSVTAGQSYQVWGAQLELASTAGPYVATAATAVSAGTNLTNLLPYSQQLNGTSWNASNASVTLGAGAAPDGSITAATVTANANSTDTFATDSVLNASLYDGETMTGSVYLRAASGTQTINLYLLNVGNNGYAIVTYKTITLTTAWQRFSVTGTLQNGLTSLYMQIGGGGTVTAGQSFQVWGAQIQLGSTSGPYVATSALPVIAGQDLINILPNSQGMNGPSWGVINGSEAANSATAPDGTSTAATVTANASSTDTYASATVPNPSLYDGETVTGSVYLRVTSGTQTLNLYLINVGDNSYAIVTYKTITLTTAWQRFSVTGTLQNGLTGLYMQIGGGNTVTAGQRFQLWGAQMVVGTDAAPYTPTASGTTNVATNQPATLVPDGLNETYSYDSFGNIQQKGSFTASYTAQNQLVDGLYDAAGNLLSNYLNRMTWDAESKLISVDGATYIYDGQGDRVEKQGVGVTDTIFFGGRPLARYSAGQWTDLIYGPNGMLAEVGGTETAAPAYRLLDHLGTEVGTVDSTGILTNPLDYTPFGQIFSGSTNDPYLFTGKERDAESGLDYFKYRYYESNMGRWMSPDPSELTPADLGNPQSLNLYNYVGNNPLTRVDLDGLCWKGFQWACDAIQSLDNGVHGLGFQTNAGVDREQHNANQLLHHDGVQTEGLSRRQVRKAYKLDMALGSVRSQGDDGFTYATRIRPSAAQARAIWEKATGGKVPYDESLGRFYDMAHKTPIGDGGSPRDPANLEPMLHSDHVDSHRENGDFARWGARGATPEEPADVTIEPTVPVEPPIIIDPIP
jgi:RHS repeat-associated protein